MSQQLYEAAEHGRLDEFRQLVKEHRELNGDELRQYHFGLVSFAVW
jgi:hypothetical protein